MKEANSSDMKQLFISLFLLSANSLNAQDTSPEIKRHFQYMDSLWNIDQYANLIKYAKGVEEEIKQGNKFPQYIYFRFLTDYLALSLKENGQIEEAEKTLIESLKIIAPKVSKIHPAYSDVLYELGNLYMETGRFTKAYDFFVQAWGNVEFYKSVGPNRYIKLATNLITVCSNTGKFDMAEFYAKKIEQSFPTAKYSKEALIDFNISLAILYLQVLGVQKAALYINKANELFLQTPFNIFTKTELNNALALALMAAGQKDSAEIILIDLAKTLDKLKMKNTDPYYLTAGNLSDIYAINEKSKKADSVLTAVISGLNGKRNKYIGALYMTLALVKVQKTEYEKGLAFMDTAISMFDEFAKNEMQFNLPAQFLKSTFLLKLGRYQEAYTVYDKVMNDFTNTIRKNINLLSELEKNSLMVSYYNMANFAQGFLNNNFFSFPKILTKKIWEQQLFFKGLAANSQSGFYERVKQNADTSIQKLYNEWRELHKYIQLQLQLPQVIRNKNLDSLSLLTEKKEKQLMLYFPAINKSNNEITVKKIYKNLQPGEAIVHFNHYMRITPALVDSLWYGAFILRYDNAQPLFINICVEGKLNNLINFPSSARPTGYQQNLLYPSDVLNQKRNLPGNHLYKLLWKPLQPYLKGIKTVFIISDGMLYKIALHVLPTNKGGYVFDKYNIRYLYHSSALLDTSFRIHKKSSGVQLWGGIHYNSTISLKNSGVRKKGKHNLQGEINKEIIEPDWNYLPGTAQEIKSIAKLCLSKNISFEIFSQNSATENTFKQNFGNNYDIVHIATHGVFDSGYFSRKPEFRLFSNLAFTLLKNPMKQVALVMANRNLLKSSIGKNLHEQDGLLNAEEITKLTTNEKQLVVLSACESGTGNIISAEGVYGMVRAFKMTGAKRILISLWKVPDKQTKEMMLVFYKKILDGNTEAIALRQAQQYLRKKYPPYYWGGFILVE